MKREAEDMSPIRLAPHALSVKPSKIDGSVIEPRQLDLLKPQNNYVS